ncbi:glycosyltransferase family 2 protein [Paenibacillus camerounensis]|uniref:glycosyltransferase family 2 protein n=1 Tax=Paenibacillus camerounensis TaxID=1243663 RepID=UPI0005AB883F|nr:glycosyltransferase family 2 protein [Paenibacillus camerounensis]
MNIVITMAGMGSRFQKAGYNVPKYMIPAKGRSLFYWSLISLQNFIREDATFIFIVRHEDGADEFIKTECDKLKISNYEVVGLDSLTDGQATSVLFAEPFWKPDEPLLIYNIDTHVNPAELEFTNNNQMDGWIPCFEALGDHWSFVKVNGHGIATEVREKKRISENATIGLYWFSSPAVYKKAYADYYSISGHEEKGEKYIAPLYNQLISDGRIVTISLIPAGSVHILGTPEELNIFQTNSYSL